jgi:hypothetical protein
MSTAMRYERNQTRSLILRRLGFRFEAFSSCDYTPSIQTEDKEIWKVAGCSGMVCTRESGFSSID